MYIKFAFDIHVCMHSYCLFIGAFLLQICLHIANLCYVVGIVANGTLAMYEKLGSDRFMWASLFPFPTLLLFLFQTPKHWRSYLPVVLFHIVVSKFFQKIITLIIFDILI